MCVEGGESAPPPEAAVPTTQGQCIALTRTARAGGGAWRRPAKEAGWRSSSVPLLSLGKPSVCISRQDLEEQLAADASPPQRPELPEGRLAQKSPVPPWPGPRPGCLGLCLSGVGGTEGTPGVLAESPVLGAPAGPSRTRAPAVRH